MPLQSVGFADLSRFDAQVAPTSGRTCLVQGNRHHHGPFSCAAESFVLGADFGLLIGIERALLTLSGGQPAGKAETDSAANQFGAPQSAEDPRGIFPFFVARVCPSRCPRISGWRVIMKTVDTVPGESNASIISSIINSVCPQCGGRMSAFQCEGRCCRNWLAEWECANQTTRSPGSRVSGHRPRSMR